MIWTPAQRIAHARKAHTLAALFTLSALLALTGGTRAMRVEAAVAVWFAGWLWGWGVWLRRHSRDR